MACTISWTFQANIAVIILNCTIEPCADFLVSAAAAQRSIFVGGGAEWPLLFSNIVLILFILFIQAIFIAPLSEFHAKAPQATASEGFAQSPNVAARTRVEPMTHRTKGVDATFGF